MLLSLLSDTFVSDTIDDAGRGIYGAPRRADAPLHFPALCRGLIVLAALALPVGLTIMGNMAPIETDVGLDAPPPAAGVSGTVDR